MSAIEEPLCGGLPEPPRTYLDIFVVYCLAGAGCM